MTDKRKEHLRNRLKESRARLYNLDSSFAEPLFDMLFVATNNVKRISTNGKCIYFDADWVLSLGERELDFIISHQLMHIELGHIDRSIYYAGDRFHLACDIVANSYLRLLGWEYSKLPKIGTVYHETFFPRVEGRELTAEEAMSGVPFDPSALGESSKRRYMIDSEEWWEKKGDLGESGVIVLSPGDANDDLDCDASDIGCDVLWVEKKRRDEKKAIFGLTLSDNASDSESRDFDGHSSLRENKPLDDKPAEDAKKPNGKPQSMGNWDKRASDMIESVRNVTAAGGYGAERNGFVERAWQRATASSLDWRELIDVFIQEEVCDYSFTPPDKRIHGEDFFLPEYNVMKESPHNVLLLVDTSGSIDDEKLSDVYGEIYNAIMQFDGGLVGKLGFFDTQVYPPSDFSDITDIASIKPVGGGGTSFRCVLDYVNEVPENEAPSSIVIFTDGQAEFPGDGERINIPVLWIISGSGVVPPWGKYVFMK